ncbi:protein GLE1-like isoform X4 [Salvia divinorum]|uniref:mRNA export factor GLE1 n=1 Tax=Salvia divinorum TaxID=28513 RepID=A0ABD1I932_SALDI
MVETECIVFFCKIRGVIELGFRCPQNVNGIAADPQPDWSFDNLLSELDSIDKELNLTLDFPSPFTKKEPRDLKASTDKRGFVMRVSDHETDYADADSDSEVEVDNSLVASGRRFTCDELYMSDDSEDGASLGMQCHQLMDRARLAEAAVYELTDERRFNVTEVVRSKISNLETELVKEKEKFVSLTTTIHKYRELQQERERKLDLQYQRTIAEALDNHLTVVQRDHEHISQLEERRIRDDMARAEAKRREKAIQEEKTRQERIKAEEEARLKSEMVEKAKAAALEAEKKAAEEAAAKHASASDAAPNAGKDSKEAPGPSSSTYDVKKGTQSSVKNIIRASQNALELEKRRQQMYEELSTKIEPLNQDYQSLGRTIGRLIRTISATIDNIRTRAEEIMKLMNSPQYPQPISIKLFAEKIVSNCTNQRSSNAIFASSRVVVLVTSKTPLAMDILIAELNRICIYTVPKHISYSKEAFRTRDDYFKAIGYKEVDGKIEGLDEYLERLSSYMKLYGALVQTEVRGCQNLHGMKEGWAWLARFLNTIPSNLFTAIALDSFLGMAGYGMYCRYKNQFEKLLSVIGRDFVNALQEGGGDSRSAKVSKVKMSIQNYIESKQYKKEPEGLQLRDRLDSNELY